ncbi:hypothetical protein STEG23_017892, partial [Scotinomys teguina]
LQTTPDKKSCPDSEAESNKGHEDTSSNFAAKAGTDCPTMSYIKAHDNVFLFVNVKEKNVKAPVSARST